MITAVVGAGGKTTLVHKLAEEYRHEGKKVFVTTSTHMFCEPDTLVSDQPEEIISHLKSEGYVMAGLQEGTKIKELPLKVYEEVCQYADEVLIEADGSKCKPIKFPAKWEPVIYDNVDRIIVVGGLQAIGHPVKEVAFRLEEVKQCLGIEENTVITEEHIQKLIQKGYVEPLQIKYPDKILWVYETVKNMLRKEERLIITFHTTTEAMAMERCCKEQGAPGRLIPVPKEISAGCGMAWCVKVDSKEFMIKLMQDHGIEPQEVRVCMV